MADHRFTGRSRLIRTDRLVLRPFRDEDMESCLGILCSSEVNRTYMLPDFADRSAAEKMFLRLKELSGAEKRFVYAVSLDDALIGFVNEVDVSGGVVEVGYVIAPGMWNRGYATEALRAVIEEMFRLGFSAVRAGYFEGNAASRRVMEKSGMVPTGETEEIEYRGKIHRCPCMEIRK